MILEMRNEILFFFFQCEIYPTTPEKLTLKTLNYCIKSVTSSSKNGKKQSRQIENLHVQGCLVQTLGPKMTIENLHVQSLVINLSRQVFVD